MKKYKLLLLLQDYLVEKDKKYLYKVYSYKVERYQIALKLMFQKKNKIERNEMKKEMEKPFYLSREFFHFIIRETMKNELLFEKIFPTINKETKLFYKTRSLYMTLSILKLY